MKKLFCLTMAMALTALLAACGGASNDGGASTGSAGASAGASTGSEGAVSTGFDIPADCQTAKGYNEDGMLVLTVGASPTPHAQILESVKDVLAQEGIDLQVVEYSDYVVPNTAVDEGEIDCNYFQHTPYLDTFNNENGTDLVSVAKIHYEPFGMYSNTITDVNDLPDGATIALPNDGSNEARALYLLEDLGLITVDHDAAFQATVLDITSNPKNFTFRELEAAMVARALDDVDAAIVNGNYALEAQLDINNAIASEDPSSNSAQTYANIVACKAGNEGNWAIGKLVEALQSEATVQYIADTFNGAVVAIQ